MANYTHVSCGEKLDLDAQRRVHSPEPMAAKSAELREAFKQQHAAEETVQINCSWDAGFDDSLKKEHVFAVGRWRSWTLMQSVGCVRQRRWLQKQLSLDKHSSSSMHQSFTVIRDQEVTSIWALLAVQSVGCKYPMRCNRKQLS